eukprot:403352288
MGDLVKDLAKVGIERLGKGGIYNKGKHEVLYEKDIPLSIDSFGFQKDYKYGHGDTTQFLAVLETLMSNSSTEVQQKVQLAIKMVQLGQKQFKDQTISFDLYNCRGELEIFLIEYQTYKSNKKMWYLVNFKGPLTFSPAKTIVENQQQIGYFFDLVERNKQTRQTYEHKLSSTQMEQIHSFIENERVKYSKEMASLIKKKKEKHAKSKKHQTKEKIPLQSDDKALYAFASQAYILIQFHLYGNSFHLISAICFLIFSLTAKYDKVLAKIYLILMLWGFFMMICHGIFCNIELLMTLIFYINAIIQWGLAFCQVLLYSEQLQG